MTVGPIAPPAVALRYAPVPRVSKRMQDVRALCAAPPPAPPLAAAASPPCLEALDQLEREVAHERYLRAWAEIRTRCLLKAGADACDGERRA